METIGVIPSSVAWTAFRRAKEPLFENDTAGLQVSLCLHPD